MNQLTLKYSPRSDKIDMFLSEVPEKPTESWVRKNIGYILTPIWMVLLFVNGMGWLAQPFGDLLWWVLGILQTIGFLMTGIMVAALSYTRHTLRTIIEGDKLFSLALGDQHEPLFNLDRYRMRVADFGKVGEAKLTLWRFLLMSLPYWALLMWNGWIVIALMSMAAVVFMQVTFWLYQDLLRIIFKEVDPAWNGDVTL